MSVRIDVTNESGQEIVAKSRWTSTREWGGSCQVSTGKEPGAFFSLLGTELQRMPAVGEVA